MNRRSRCSSSLSRFWRLPLVAFALASPTAYSQQISSGESLDLTSLVPPRAESMVYIRDLPAVFEKLRASPFLGFYTDQRAGDFLKPLREMLEERSPEIAALFEGDGSAVTNLIRGPILAATLAPDENAKKAPPGYMIAFEHASDRDTLLKLMSPRPRRGTAVRRLEEKVGGLRHYRILTTREEAAEIKHKGRGRKNHDRHAIAGAATPLRLAKRLVTTEEHLYIGPHVLIRTAGAGYPMKEALERLASPGRWPSMREAERRRATIEPFGPSPDIEVYVDLELARRTRPKLRDHELFGSDSDLERLGIHEFKAAALGVDFLDDRLSIKFNLHVPWPRRGLGRLLFMSEMSGSAPSAARPFTDLVPPDAIGYTLIGTGLWEMVDELRGILNRGAPRLGSVFNAYLDSFNQMTSIDFEHDVLAYLGSRWGVFARPALDGRALRDGQDQTLVVEVARPRALRPGFVRWLHEFAELFNFKVERRTMRGREYFRLRGAEIEDGGLVSFAQFANICLADGWLFFSPRVEHIEAALANLERSGGPNGGRSGIHAELDRVAAGGPEANLLESFVSARGYGSFFGSPVMKLIGSVMGGAGAAMVDFDASPDVDAWRDYFGSAGGSARASGDTLEARLFLLYPQQTEAFGD